MHFHFVGTEILFPFTSFFFSSLTSGIRIPRGKTKMGWSRNTAHGKTKINSWNGETARWKTKYGWERRDWFTFTARILLPKIPISVLAEGKEVELERGWMKTEDYKINRIPFTIEKENTQGVAPAISKSTFTMQHLYEPGKYFIHSHTYAQWIVPIEKRAPEWKNDNEYRTNFFLPIFLYIFLAQRLLNLIS